MEFFRHYSRQLGVQVEADERSCNPNKITIAIFNSQHAITTIVESNYTEDYKNRALYYCSALCAFAFSKMFFNRNIKKGDGKIDTYLRKDIKTTYDYTCQICGESIIKKNVSIHHVCATYLGGQSIPNNLVLFCGTHHERLHELTQQTEMWMCKNFNRFDTYDDLFISAIDIIKFCIDEFFSNIRYKKIITNDLSLAYS